MYNPMPFRFYAVETNLPKVVLSSDAMIPAAARWWMGLRSSRRVQRGHIFVRSGSSLRMKVICKKAWGA